MSLYPHAQDIVSMEVARPHNEKNPEWRKKQEEKISKGIEDDETKEYQIDKNFESLLDISEKEDPGMKVNVGTEEDPEWVQL